MEGVPASCGSGPRATAQHEHGQCVARYWCDCFLITCCHHAAVKHMWPSIWRHGPRCWREDAQGSPINHVHAILEHDYGQLSPSFVQQKQRSTSSSSEWCAHIWPTVGRACARIARTAVVVSDDLSLSPYIPSYSLAAIA